MHEGCYQLHGYRVACTAPVDAAPVVERLFGAPLARDADTLDPAAQTVHLRIDTSDADGAPVPPPYFPPEWEDLDEVVIDAGSSTAAISPAQWAIRVTLARSDLANPIVWGRWLVEKAFLILTLRSDRHYGLHAGALAVDGRAALVTADSGVGKSTFTAWGLLRGADFAGEDAMVRHLDDPQGRFWGYPRCAYLDPALIGSRPELAGAEAVPVPGRNKHRVEWPASFAARLRPAVRPRALLVLTREHSAVRPLDVDAAVKWCRSDFAAGKRSPEVLERVEGDLRRQLAGMVVAELGLGPDLDANLSRLSSLLRD
ncbi:MAG: hypothetical protein ACJ74O_08690 [Frankiaceae bacterium]